MCPNELCLPWHAISISPSPASSGVSDIQIDMEGQKVTVESSVDKDTLLATITKTGKACSYAGEA